MLDRFREHLAKSALISPGSVVVVGYSGGPDSTCLLHLLHLAGIDVIVAHLHHGQRQEADEEVRSCAAFCESLGVPFISGKADVPRMCKDLKIGIEEAGRNARYEFLQSVVKSSNAQLIATAHTRDDHVETVLLNVVRGTGLAGLAGVPERRENIIRPLRPFSRKETQDYCKGQGFWTCSDPSNTDEAFSRARMRAKVIPELRQMNPGVDQTIERLASIVREESDFLDGVAARALEQAELRVNGELSFLTEGCEFVFDRSILIHLPGAILKRSVRLAVRALGASLDWNGTEIACRGLLEEDKGSVTSEGGLVAVEWDEERVLVRQLQDVVPFRFNLACPGETVSEEFGWAIQCRQSQSEYEEPLQRASLKTAISLDKAKGPLYFRSAKVGDEIRPLGFEGRRKVSDLLSEAQLTWSARKRLPIVCDMLGVVWVPGVCLSETVRPEPSSKQVLLLCFGPQGG